MVTTPKYCCVFNIGLVKYGRLPEYNRTESQKQPGMGGFGRESIKTLKLIFILCKVGLKRDYRWYTMGQIGCPVGDIMSTSAGGCLSRADEPLIYCHTNIDLLPHNML